MILTNRKPTTVGEVLTQEFLEPLGLSQTKLAERMGVSPRLVNELCRNKRAVTADTALMLGRVFGNSAQFWLNLQQKSDLWEATHDAKRRERIEKAKPLEVA
ncbi:MULTISPECIES: HigA family addiction module antitoxin [Halomonas]|uniref:HTH domain protein n=2 Tax=Halomonas TaxID=2745 RepID=E1VBY7_HALED|nr:MULTISPECIES: HigA family addiction module antitoxin [Halomonas]MDL4863820.1 HigA family addiction module antitoxin [Halomonas elongata]MDR5858452.1 HigA family addiction module antitoxin [Halomonas eurihalina]RAW06180.1 addiction module antidote protein, HigA family [Halomonas elongata]TZG31670.1 HigA family addiction module antidote protein [Halomonas eurihalina]WBF19530.1 HigA family addiction module antitoxin [Halomonas elongata]